MWLIICLREIYSYRFLGMFFGRLLFGFMSVVVLCLICLSSVLIVCMWLDVLDMVELRVLFWWILVSSFVIFVFVLYLLWCSVIVNVFWLVVFIVVVVFVVEVGWLLVVVMCMRCLMVWNVWVFYVVWVVWLFVVCWICW